MKNKKQLGIVFAAIAVIAVVVLAIVTTNNASETATAPESAPSTAGKEPASPGTSAAPSTSTTPETQPEPSKQPAPPPPPDEYITTSGCLRGYGEPGQCVPAFYPDTDGNPSPVTCQDLRSAFPKGFKAAEGDPAGLDLNGDGTACGENE